MKMKRYILSALTALLLFASCKDETMTLSLSATLEQPTPEGEEGKNYLHNEEWIYWEEGDQIKISGADNAGRTFTLSHGEGTREALFGEHEIMAYPEMKAVYPAESYVDNAIAKIRYPATMSYRSTAVHDVGPDSTFGKGSSPMVAYFVTDAATNTAYVDFHSVSGLVRVHIYSTSSTAATVSQVKFTSVSKTDANPLYTAKQLSGVFNVNAINSNAPYLSPEGTDATNSITITMPEEGKVIGGANGEYLTFYLPLPALNSGTAGGANEADNRTFYALEMEVTSNQGTFKKTMGVRIQRNTMMKMPALDITSWENNGTASAGLVGDGSEMRPFQIYNYKDLKLVREAFNNSTGGNVVINGKIVTSDTYFKISRSDIRLTATGDSIWTEGIRNFKGRMKGSMSNATNFGITNNSHVPLFESISPQGHVEYITVKSTGTITHTSDEPFSPFCISNYGMIDNCQNYANVDATNDVAGLCVYNHGTITSGANVGEISSSIGRAAGFCLENYGILQGFSISSAKISGPECAAICFLNEEGGVVRDCVETVNFGNFGIVGSEVRTGGLVYTNMGLIENCLVNGVVQSSLGESHIGAVVYENIGIIDNCRSNVNVLNVTTMAGIAAYQIGADALISNCGVQSGSRISASAAVGGIVAHLQGGAVKNCYNRSEVSSTVDGAAVGGIVAILGTANGSIGTLVLNNVYSSHGYFYGRTASATSGDATTNDVENGDMTVTLTNCYSQNEKILTNGTGTTITIPSISSLTGTTLLSVLNGAVQSGGLGASITYYPTIGANIAITWNSWNGDEMSPVLIHPSISQSTTPTHRRSNADRIATARRR